MVTTRKAQTKLIKLTVLFNLTENDTDSLHTHTQLDPGTTFPLYVTSIRLMQVYIACFLVTKHTDYGLLCRGGLFYAALTRISANQHRPRAAPACDPGGLNGGLLTHPSEKPTQVHRHADGSRKSPPRSLAGGGGVEGVGWGGTTMQLNIHDKVRRHAAGDQKCTVM